MKRKKSLIFVSVVTVFLVALSLCEIVGAEEHWRVVTIGPEGNFSFNCLAIPDEQVGVADTTPVVIYEGEWYDDSGSFLIARRHRGEGAGDGIPDCNPRCPRCIFGDL